MDVINKRRSIRSFKNDYVDDYIIEKLLRAGMQAPSAGNQMPWEFVVVRNKEKLKNLAGLSPYASSLNSSPVGIIVLCNNNKLRFPENIQQDLGASTENILLEAVDNGLGTVWLGIMPVAERMEIVSKLLNLPEGVEAYAAIAVGYPLDESDNKYIDRYDESKVFYESYGLK